MPVFLQLHRLRQALAAARRRLLCVLFVRVQAMPVESRTQSIAKEFDLALIYSSPSYVVRRPARGEQSLKMISAIAARSCPTSIPMLSPAHGSIPAGVANTSMS